jgi:outer membrane protein assembly factor BamB
LTGRREARISDSPRLLWTFDAKSGIESTAAIVDGKALVGTAEAGLLALDLSSAEKGGKELWRSKTDAGIRSSPGVRNGKVYFGDDKGIFHCVDLKDGKPLWKFESEGGEIISSANFDGDAVLFGCYDSYLYCLSAEDGKLRWKYQTQGQVHSTPAVAAGNTFVAGCDEHLRVINIANGQEVAELEMGAQSAASPAVAGERLFIGTLGSQVFSIDWKQRKVLWSYEPSRSKLPFHSSAAIGLSGPEKNEIVVIGGRDKLVHGLGARDGKVLWTFPAKAKVDASPVILGERVFVASLDGNLYLLDLANGKEVWKFTAGEGFVASPAAAEKKLVISTQDGLVYCFDLKP